MEELRSRISSTKDFLPEEAEDLDSLVRQLVLAENGGFFVYLSDEVSGDDFLATLLERVNEARKSFDDPPLTLDRYKAGRDASIQGKEEAIKLACRQWIDSNVGGKAPAGVLRDDRAAMRALNLSENKLFVLDLLDCSTELVDLHLTLSNVTRTSLVGSPHGSTVFLLPRAGTEEELRKISPAGYMDLRSCISSFYRFGEAFRNKR